MIDPQVYVRPVTYRPIRIYVGGQVKRPGYYTLSGDTELNWLSTNAEAQQLQAGTATDITRPGLGQLPGTASHLQEKWHQHLRSRVPHGF